MRSYRAAQGFLSRRKALVAFDEIEDVFTGEMTFLGVRAPARPKTWMNRMLENNPAHRDLDVELSGVPGPSR